MNVAVNVAAARNRFGLRGRAITLPSEVSHPAGSDSRSPVSSVFGGGIHPCRLDFDQTQHTKLRDIVQAFPDERRPTRVEFDRMNKIIRIKKASCQSCDPVQDSLCGRFHDRCQSNEPFRRSVHVAMAHPFAENRGVQDAIDTAGCGNQELTTEGTEYTEVSFQFRVFSVFRGLLFSLHFVA